MENKSVRNNGIKKRSCIENQHKQGRIKINMCQAEPTKLMSRKQSLQPPISISSNHLTVIQSRSRAWK